MTQVTSKEKYRSLCEAEESIPIFSRSWWLDATCGPSGWDVSLVEKGGRIFGALPYMRKQKAFFTLLGQPMLTQTLGPWIQYPDGQKYEKKLSHEKKIITSLIQALPEHSMFRQNAHHAYQNWLPFYWHGFTQTTRYTYVIEDLSNIENVWTNVQSRVKTDIKKAVERHELELEVDPPIEQFLSVNAKTFHRQDQQVPYTDRYVKDLDVACLDNGCRRIFLARDSRGHTHAAIYIIWDDRSAYYLMGGADPEFRGSGAVCYLLWEAIKFSSTVTRAFDFEGSMIESIENFFRGFGAIQKPYHHLVRVNSKLLRTLLLCAEAVRK